MELAEILRLIYPVSDTSVKKLSDRCEIVSFKKKDLIIRDNEVNRYLYIIKNGIVRGGFRYNKLEDTVLFGMEGDAIASAHSLRFDLPSPFFYEAITDVDALRIKFEEFNKLIISDTDLQMWWQTYLVDGMYAFEHKYAYFAMKDSYNRYITFIGMRPKLTKKVPIKYIAQYLNISRETLSRIRAKYAKD